ncbi:MAG: Hsp20/alpha crystallin family protein [Candidatus Woesebacteria bacterium]
MSYLVPRSFFTLPSLMDEDWDSGMMSNTPSGLSISDDDTSVYVEAALPGVDPTEIDITFEKGVVRIVGESKKEEKEGRKYFRRLQSSFSYQFSVPSDVDLAKDPQTKIEHGVLHLTFAKSEKAQPRKIKVA